MRRAADCINWDLLHLAAALVLLIAVSAAMGAAIGMLTMNWVTAPLAFAAGWLIGRPCRETIHDALRVALRARRSA